MKIAQIAPVNLPIPSKYGGVERIVADLTEGLRKEGHEVTVYCSGDSNISGKQAFVAKSARGNYMKDEMITVVRMKHWRIWVVASLPFQFLPKSKLRSLYAKIFRKFANRWLIEIREIKGGIK